MAGWSKDERLRRNPPPRGSGRFVFRVLAWAVLHGVAGYGSALLGLAIGEGMEKLAVNLGLVDRPYGFHVRTSFEGLVLGPLLVVTSGACMLISSMWSLSTLRFRLAYLLVPMHLSFMVLIAFAFFLPSVGLSTMWIVLPAALLVWMCVGLLKKPNPAAVMKALRSYYRGFPAQQYWIREYVLEGWVTLSPGALSELEPKPEPRPEPKADTAASAPGLASGLFDGYLSEMREMLPQLRGSVVEDEWSRLIETSLHIHRMAGADTDKYSLLNHLLASQMPNAIRLGQYFVKLGGLTESNPTRAERMREIEVGLQGLCRQFEKVQNQMVESDLAGLQTTLRLLQEDLKQAEQREARTPSL
ncbi:hypothetical protein [Burkholderia stagnalis]